MNLLTFLKSNENARKIFGKRELKIIEKQLFGIKLTQSEKNRLSRDVRKKFEFIKDISAHSFDFKLKKGKIIDNIVKDTLEIIKEDVLFRNIKKIILFGSVVENKVTFRSDIDIGVEFDKIDKKEAFLFRVRIHGRVNDKVDVQVLNILPEKIKKSISKNFKVLYERK